MEIHVDSIKVLIQYYHSRRTMKLSRLLLLLILSTASLSTLADSLTSELSTCLTDNTTGKDRKDLARWMFIAMTAHPAIKDLSNTTPEARDAANKALATLVTRLLTEQCAVQTRALFSQGNDASNAMAAAFGTLGEVAMGELMSEPHVNAAVGDYTKYLDKQKFEVLRPK